MWQGDHGVSSVSAGMTCAPQLDNQQTVEPLGGWQNQTGLGEEERAVGRGK